MPTVVGKLESFPLLYIQHHSSVQLRKTIKAKGKFSKGT